MPKDYPRLQRFWQILFGIIGVAWTVWGVIVMTLGLIADPEIRNAFLGVLGIAILFAGAFIWGPSHRFAVRHPYILFAVGGGMVALGLYRLFATSPPASLVADITLFMGGIMIICLGWMPAGEGKTS